MLRRPKVELPTRSLLVPVLALSPRRLRPSRNGPTFFEPRHDQPKRGRYT